MQYLNFWELTLVGSFTINSKGNGLYSCSVILSQIPTFAFTIPIVLYTE